MKKKVKPSTLKEEVLYKEWTLCTNGHTHWYTCGVVVEPPAITCVECGAPVIDRGKEMCGTGI